MMRILMFLVSIHILFLLPVHTELIEAYELDEVAYLFQDLDPHSLLLWDVDSTLIIPSDRVLRPGNEETLDTLVRHYLGNSHLDESKHLISHIFNNTSFCLVDDQVPDLITSLQQKAIPMIAFTAMRTGSYGIIESMEDWRFSQLRSLGIDFSKIFEDHSGLCWSESADLPGNPVFKHGVLCSDRLPKGDVLTSFLHKIDWKPKQVFFIDDNEEFLISVEEAMEAMDIPFIGIHYRATERLESPLEPEIARFQFQFLTREGVWLRDHEAAASLIKEESNSISTL